MSRDIIWSSHIYKVTSTKVIKGVPKTKGKYYPCPGCTKNQILSLINNLQYYLIMDIQKVKVVFGSSTQNNYLGYLCTKCILKKS